MEETQRQSFWGGPETDGISFSSLSKFIVCRERFRLYKVEGLKEDKGFDKAIEYGQMLHEAHESIAKHGEDEALWKTSIQAYADTLINEYIASRSDISKWATIAKRQYEVYLDYWNAKTPNQKNRKYVLQEASFETPIVLPSGRTVKLTGRFDAAFQPSSTSKSIYLQENKTKGDVDTAAIESMLSDDCQTMIYMITLRDWLDKNGYEDHHIEGVHYNVIRRPLSWGKYCLKPYKAGRGKNPKPAEKLHEFIDRLIKNAVKADPEWFFHRFTQPITQHQIERFKKESLFPILEQLCDWWESIADNPFDPWTTNCPDGRVHIDYRITNPLHFRRPLGIYDGMARGYTGDYHNYIFTGSMTGLRQKEWITTNVADSN